MKTYFTPTDFIYNTIQMNTFNQKWRIKLIKSE